MFCKYCGKEVKEGAKFCENCGKPLNDEPVVVEEVKQEPKVDVKPAEPKKAEKKPITKKWWFWVIIAVIVLAVLVAIFGKKSSSEPAEEVAQTIEETGSSEVKSEAKVKEPQLIEFGGYKFTLPAEFDEKSNAIDGFDVDYCPSEKEFYASLAFKKDSLDGISQREFTSLGGEVLKSTGKEMGASYKFDDTAERILVDDTSGFTMNFTNSGGKGCFGLLANEDTNTLVLVLCFVDNSDTSNYDYINDFKVMLNKAERIKTEKKEAETEKETEAQKVSGIRPEFKEALDSYEQFFNEYAELMEAYKKNPTDLTLLSKYADYMTKYADYMGKLDKLKTENMSVEESAYLIEVTARIEKTLLGVIQ